MKKIYITRHTLRMILVLVLILSAGIGVRLKMNHDDASLTVAKAEQSAMTDREQTKDPSEDTKSYDQSSREQQESLSGPDTSAGDTKETAGESTKAETSQEQDLIGVHVTGAVRYPDRVYLMPYGSRVEDAIEMAGGAGAGADLSLLNLADYVYDGQRLYVPRKGESSVAEETQKTEAAAGQKGSQKASQGEQSSNLTNLNSATKIELMELPGVGETMAQRIIDYREQNGPFQTIEELMNVQGIGQTRFDKLKALITVK